MFPKLNLWLTTQLRTCSSTKRAPVTSRLKIGPTANWLTFVAERLDLILRELKAERAPGWVVVEQNNRAVAPLESARVKFWHIRSSKHFLQSVRGL